MAINKVVYGNQTLMDLTSDTVTEQDVAQGVTFHDASGALRTGSASGGGGHIIEDASGTDLTQRSTLQFTGGLKATDDSTNGKTVVDDSATEITFTQWNNMTPEQQAAIPKAIITEVPSVDGGIQADLMTKLWENPDPTASFAAQNITLASSDYDFLLIIFSEYIGYVREYSSVVEKSKETVINITAVTGSTYTVTSQRHIAYTSDTKLDIKSAYVQRSNALRDENNNYLIPLVVYGIKKTINLEFSAIASNVGTLASNCMADDEVTSMQDVTDSIAPTDTTPATAAHAIGEQFYFNGQLVTATAAIAIGDAIAVGTNCTASDTITKQLEPKIIATAPSNQTFATQLTYLKPYYTNLTDNEKLNAKLRRGNSIFVNMHNNGQFIQTVMATNSFESVQANLNASTYLSYNGTTVTDKSNVNDTVTIELII